ncbi:spore germination protein [Cohnella endophytica]|nr:spore germination protein [Cohnella endophytica]
MKGWHKLKKYVMADLSQDSSSYASFSLGHWEAEATAEDSESTLEQAPAKMPRVDPLWGEEGPLLIEISLNDNLDWLKRRFSYPLNSGLVIRPLVIGGGSLEGAVIYLESQVDWQYLSRTVVQPLIAANLPGDPPLDVQMLTLRILTNSHATTTTYLGDIEQNVLNGSAVVIVDRLKEAVIVNVEDEEKRALESPKTENVVRGPQVGFTENLQTNLSLIRRRLNTPDLIVESGVVGKISRTRIAIVYLKTIANVELVNEVRTRIAAIQIDYVGDSGMVEQMIEDSPNSIYPGMLNTERPDRTAGQIADGYVGILVDNSPFALIVPANFPLFLQTSEDAYLRWQYSSFIRIIRTIGFFMSLYLPALYVAIANYHHEMIPTTLILAIAGTRESVPLPVAAEAFLLESMFELIREAGVRIPSVIGPTIGIVGALILGQAAVQANIVSPIVVIVTSATALASYTIPNYNMQFTTRILRFVYLGCASFLGLVGVVLLSMMLWANWAASNRFGVPNLAPIAPYRPSEDTLLRAPMKLQSSRPLSVRPRKTRKLPDVQGDAPSLPPEQGETRP